MVLSRVRISWWSVGASVPRFSPLTQNNFSLAGGGVIKLYFFAIMMIIFFFVFGDTHTRISRACRGGLHSPGASYCCPTGAGCTLTCCLATETSKATKEVRWKRRARCEQQVMWDLKNFINLKMLMKPGLLCCSVLRSGSNREGERADPGGGSTTPGSRR